MASQGPNLSSNTTDGNGDAPWINPSNGQAEDGTFTTNADTGLQYLLNADTFGFSIPGGATIVGIKAEVKIKSTLSPTTSDNFIDLIKGGSVIFHSESLSAGVTTSLQWLSTGGATDLWATSWTVADINASNFGCQVQINGDGSAGTFDIDAVRITVFYSGVGTLQQMQSTVDIKSQSSHIVRRRF